jgi:multiple sugar transport system permease protein
MSEQAMQRVEASKPREITRPQMQATTPRRRQYRRGVGRATPYVLLAPALVLFAALFITPLVYAVYLSLHGSRVASSNTGFGVARSVFVGLANYTSALRNRELYAGFERLGIYALMVIPITQGLALLFALLLDSARSRMQKFTRLAIFVPYAVPGVTAGIMWGFLYLPETSPANYLLSHLGVQHLNLLSSHWIYPALANIVIWESLGFNMIVLYTGLRAAPQEIYEAAVMDGCGEIQLALKVKVPLLRQSLALTVLFSLIATLQTYSEPTTVSAMTTTVSSTFFPLMTVYRYGFSTSQPNEAAAMAILIATATMVVSFLVLRVVQSRTARQDS